MLIVYLASMIYITITILITVIYLFHYHHYYYHYFTISTRRQGTELAIVCYVFYLSMLRNSVTCHLLYIVKLTYFNSSLFLSRVSFLFPFSLFSFPSLSPPPSTPPIFHPLFPIHLLSSELKKIPTYFRYPHTTAENPPHEPFQDMKSGYPFKL